MHSPMRVPPLQSSTAAAARAQRPVGVAPAQLAGHAREPRAEHERLHPGPRGHARLHVLQQHAAVRRHRAAHVAHEHEPPRPRRLLAVAALEQLAAGAQRGADRRAQVVLLAPAPGRRPCAGSGASARAARSGAAAAAPPRARRPCRRRSPSPRSSSSSLHAAGAGMSSAPGASLPCGGMPTRGSACLAISPSSSSGSRVSLGAEHRGEGGRERGHLRARRAQRGAQRVERPRSGRPRRPRPARAGRPAPRRARPARRARAAGGERATWAETWSARSRQAPVERPRPPAAGARPQRGLGARDRGLVGLPAPGAAIDVLARLLGDLRVAGGDAGTARHPRGPCRGARDRCPRGPSARRRGCRRATRRRRAPAARAPR